MYQNKKRNRWEATEPVHLVGWEIQSMEDTPDRNGFMAVTVRNKMSGNVRVVYTLPGAIPIGSVERGYGN